MYSFNYILLHSTDWHLLDVVHNILNMLQRYATSAAGQTCSYSVKAAKGGIQYLFINENVSLLVVTTWLGNSILPIWHQRRDRQVALGKLVMKMCGLQQDFVT